MNFIAGQFSGYMGAGTQSQETVVRSRLECAQFCAYTLQCLCYTFDPPTGLCQTFAFELTTDVGLTPTPAAVHYRKKVCSATAPAGINTINPTVTDRLPGTVITYSCLPNYQPLTGTDMSLTCASNETWGTPPTCVHVPCETGWTMHNDRCLKFVGTQLTWTQSQTNCQSMQANLAHVYSVADIASIESVLTCNLGSSGCEPWLGIHDVNSEGSFVSVSGKAVSTEVANHLVSGSIDYPNTGAYDCSYLDTYGHTLGMWDCTDGDSSVCEK